MGPGNQVVIASKAGPDFRSRGDSVAAIGPSCRSSEIPTLHGQCFDACLPSQFTTGRNRPLEAFCKLPVSLARVAICNRIFRKKG
jgi:hypothetical protein